MTADSMDEKITEFAKLARDRADERDQSIENVVHSMTHESYLMKHTTAGVLRELQELTELYPDAFYDGAANDHLMQYVEDDSSVDFWHDYPFRFLAAGLEWAVLHQLGTKKTQV